MKNWKETLQTALTEHDKTRQEIDLKIKRNWMKAEEYLVETAQPVFIDIKSELAKHGRTARIDYDDYEITVTVMHNNEVEFIYRLCVTISPTLIQPYAICSVLDEMGKAHLEKLFVRYDRNDYSIKDHGPEDIALNFIVRYQTHLSEIERLAEKPSTRSQV